MSIIDKVKKDNLVIVFNHYINIIDRQKDLINQNIERTNHSELMALCSEAIERYDEFFKLDGDNSKVNRWLGYVQGILIAAHIVTVDSEREFTRPYLTAHRPFIDKYNALDSVGHLVSKSYYTKFLESDDVNPHVVIKNMTSVTLGDSITANFDAMFGNMKTITEVTPNGVKVTPVDYGLVLIKRGDKFLGVSRKDNPNDIGLPGGKCNENESFKQCAIREVAEETGFSIRILEEPHYDGIYKDYSCRTYFAEITGKLAGVVDPSETGLVGFYDKQEFLDGSFGAYNELMFKHFGY